MKKINTKQSQMIQGGGAVTAKSSVITDAYRRDKKGRMVPEDTASARAMSEPEGVIKEGNPTGPVGLF